MRDPTKIPPKSQIHHGYWSFCGAFLNQSRCNTPANTFRAKLTAEPDPAKAFLRRPVDDGNVYLGRYEYTITELFRAGVSGKLASRPAEDIPQNAGQPLPGRELGGTAYFQRVTVRAPAPPWYWAIVHFPDGSFMDYFQPRIGDAMLRTNPPDGRVNERFSLPLSSNIEFYNARENRRYIFRKMKVKKGSLI